MRKVLRSEIVIMKEWGGLAIAGERIQEISEGLKRLSKCFMKDFQMTAKLSEEQKEQIFENVCASFCSGCEQETRCREYYSYDNFSAAMQLLQEPSQEELEEDAAAFLERCLHPEEFLLAATEEMTLAGQQLQLRNRMAEVRMLAGGQLKELSLVLREFSEDICRGKRAEEKYSEKLFVELRKHHIEMEDAVFLENKNGMTELLLTLRSRWNGCVTAKEAAEAAGNAIGKRLCPFHGTRILTDHFEVLRFSQEPQFKLFTGIARTAKAGSAVSGDNFSIKELPNAVTALMLSDGMGSGVRAQQESCTVIELLEEFLEAGFSVNAAMRMVNTLFLTDMQNPSAVTADISLLNLYNGMAEFYKAGAAPTYLKRGSSVITIDDSQLPAGMFSMMEDGELKAHKLYQGDTLIMMTDGVLEALHAENKEQMMEGYLSMLPVRSPQEMAERILNFAREHEEDGPHDDMTVLTAVVYENRKKKRGLFS